MIFFAILSALLACTLNAFYIPPRSEIKNIGTPEEDEVVGLSGDGKGYTVDYKSTWYSGMLDLS